MENCIATELFVKNPVFDEVSRIARLLEGQGIRTLVLSFRNTDADAHLVVDNADLHKARDILRRQGIPASEKEIVLVKMADIPGSMAQTTGKLAAAGVNISYAFSAPTTPGVCYALFGTSDNRKALDSVC